MKAKISATMNEKTAEVIDYFIKKDEL